MLIDNNDVDSFTIEELDKLFNDDDQLESSPDDSTESSTNTESQENAKDDSNQESSKAKDDVDKTKAFAKRLKESTDKARSEEREAIAKSLGYESYEQLQKKHEEKLYEDKGLNPQDVSPIVDEVVKQRLENDPRMKELEEFKRKQVEEFGRKELAEITKLTGGEVTRLSQLPKEVIDLWKQKGSLKAAYLELEGEKLITKIRSEQSNGTTEHLKSPTGGKQADVKERLLTDEEKRVWKLFNPKMTDEELNKQTVKI